MSAANDLPVRTLAALVMIVVAGGALWFGGFAFWILAAAAALFMMDEWANLEQASGRHKRLAQYALFVPLALLSPWGAGPDFFVIGLLVGAAFLTVIVTQRPRLALGTLYCGLPVVALVLLRDQGLLLAFWAMALVWATDIGAYFAGRTIGGPKLARRISPSKTISGLCGGMLAAGLLGWALHDFYGLPATLALATPILAALAQAGDLFESALKRRAGVKDSGSMLPGHGGVLDRLDGLVPVAPVAALLVELFRTPT